MQKQASKSGPAGRWFISIMLSFEWLIAAAAAKSLQSYQTLRDPMDCSPPGFSIHGIFQAKVLEWGAIVSLTTWIPF